ncbi:MAG TPA: hypothetical protein VFE33_29360 [Thermoanaerobaculia bacterium]|nr:hypothetical protein [Thermoanaerobaculia bacterium]
MTSFRSFILPLCLLCLLGAALALPAAAAPSAASVSTFLATLSESAPAACPTASAASSNLLGLDLLQQPVPATSCTFTEFCRCGQQVSCTSATGNCQRTPGCAVVCNGIEHVCPPCHGFACD